MNIKIADEVWIKLAETGACALFCGNDVREDVASKLNSEAKEEGVSLRINRAKNLDVLYVYLRKVA